MSGATVLGRTGFALAVLLAASPLAAQPYLVKNIDDAASGLAAGSNPQILGTAGDQIVFTADDLVHGAEPWATDGTPEQTFLLADLAPGPRASHIVSLGSVAGRQILLATATDPLALEVPTGQVWATDGTVSGTDLLVPGLLTSRPYVSGWPVGAVADPPRLFFGLRAPIPAHEQLWVTDGTPEGTRFLRELRMNPPIAGAALGTSLLFYDGLGTLWRSDSTMAGTEEVAEVGLHEMAPLGNGRAVFDAFTVDAGEELWVTDGTAAGTRLLADLLPGSESSGVGGLIPDLTSGQAFFLARDPASLNHQLWRTDGTPGGTIRLTTGALVHWSRGLPVVGGRLFVEVEDSILGRELLVSDGTPLGTLLLDLCSGPCSTSARLLTATSVGLAFVVSEGGSFGTEPWISDGTLAGTRRLGDLCPGPCSSDTRRILDLGGRIVGLEPEAVWVSDGTAGGTSRSTLLSGVVFDTSAAVAAPGVAVLPAGEATLGREPWRTDGTGAGTFPLGDLAAADASSDPAHFTRLGDRLYFAASARDMRGLWHTDGSSAGTQPVADVATSGAEEDLTGALAVGSDLFYVVERPAETELWRTDGTPSGTVRLLLTGSEPGRTSTLAAVGETVFLLGPGVWRSGRSPGTSIQVAALDVAVSVAPPHGVLGSRLYFAAAVEGTSDFELWTTDGTAAGTRLVRDVRPGASGSRPRDFTPFAGSLFFRAGHDSSFVGLWRTDGTGPGTELVFEYDPFDGVADARILGTVGGRLVFFDGSRLLGTSGDQVELLGLLYPDGISAGVEFAGKLFFTVVFDTFDGFERDLWSTDGTPAGTGPVLDILPPEHHVANVWDGGVGLVLEVFGPFSRHEFWVTDGTSAGTRRIADLTGLDFGSDGVRRLAPLADQILFAARTPDVGTELWGADLDAAIGPLGPPAAPSGLAAESVGESSVLLTWQDESEDEAAFRIFATTYADELGGVVDVPAGTTAAVVHGLPLATPFDFTVAAVNAMGVSPESGEASATPLPGEPAPCVADGSTLCLLGGRFAVSVLWRDQHNGGTGTGGALPLPGADRTGRFWFFSPDNVELIVKALDGRPVNGSFWSFYGALSDVEYWVTVVDSATGRSRTYHNHPGEICGVPDTAAFPQDGARVAGERETRVEDAVEIDWPATAPTGARPRLRSFALPGPPSASLHGSATPRGGTCVPGAQTLCLLADRLRVEVAWHDQHNGGNGTGQAVPGSDRTGYFWFFNQDNLELVVKALDGTAVNGHLWLFYGALSDVEYTITVTETVTQAVRTYHNPPGEFCGRGDTAAF